MKILLSIFLFLFSLLTVFQPPTYWYWKVSIPIQEGGHFFALVAAALLIWHLNFPFLWFGKSSNMIFVTILLIGTLGLFLSPLIRTAFSIPRLNKNYSQFIQSLQNIGAESTFDPKAQSHEAQSFYDRKSPLNLLEIFSGISLHKKNIQIQSHKDFDFYPAQNSSNQPAPCILVIHGGGWDSGSRKDLDPLNYYLAQLGYNVVAIDYRLAPDNKYPAPLEDIAVIMDSLNAQAKELKIDLNRMAFLGRSAGGQIALQAAYTAPAAWKIRSVIAFYAPADMVFGYQVPCRPWILDSKKIMENYIGAKFPDLPSAYFASSPIEHLNKNSPPTLLLHGHIDELVAYAHTERMERKLTELAVPHLIVDLPWAAHGYDFIFSGPGSQISLFYLERFLKRTLD